MNWQETENYLNAISQRGIKPGLHRMQILMQRLDHPKKKFKSVHVTGTNGKGSVCAMLESILREAGVRTGFYSSPHLLDLRERITIGGEQIDFDSLSYWVSRIRNCAGGIESELTYFEVMTAVAFCYFAEKKVELAIVEVGLGGRLDATNVLPAPEVCIITNIALEHTDYLGKRVAEIAEEKAGIVKEHTVCVTGASGLALKIVQRICKAHDVKTVRVVMGTSIQNRDRTKEKPLLENALHCCALKGNFQRKNIGIVLETVQILRKKRWGISERHILEGLKKVVWPGRFDRKVIQLNIRKIPVLLDGAHNPAAIKALMSALKTTRLNEKKCLLVFNALRDKEIGKMVRCLSQGLRISEIFVPSLDTNRTAAPDLVQAIFGRTCKGIPLKTFDSVSGMWSLFQTEKWDSDAAWILVTGSLYLIGETFKKFTKSGLTPRRFDRLNQTGRRTLEPV